MNAIRATVLGGRVEVLVPGGLPDGTEVLVEVRPLPVRKIGILESEWTDDPEALADWATWLEAIEPIESSPGEQIDPTRFDEEFRRYNLEAVRRQMEEGAH